MNDKTYKLFKDIAIEKDKMDDVKKILKENIGDTEMA